MVEKVEEKNKGFTPTKVYGFGFYNSIYNLVPGYENIEHVTEDAIRVRSWFKLMNIPDDHIFEYHNADYEKMDYALKKHIKNRFTKANTHPSRKILVFVWFGGHGEMYDGSPTTQVVLNDKDPSKRRFPLEKLLADFSFHEET